MTDEQERSWTRGHIAATRSMLGHVLLRELVAMGEEISPEAAILYWDEQRKTMNKEQLRRNLPGKIDALRAELADVCAKWTFCLVDDRAAKHEQVYRKQAAMLGWRIDRATEVLQELETPGVFLYDMLPDWTCERFGEKQALLWWADRIIYAGMDRAIKSSITYT